MKNVEGHCTAVKSLKLIDMHRMSSHSRIRIEYRFM